MSSGSMNYVGKMVEKAYFIGAADLIAAAARTNMIPVTLIPMYTHTAKVRARTYAGRLQIDEKALRHPNDEEPGMEGNPSTNTQPEANILSRTTQPTLLAAELSSMAVSIGVLAGKVDAESWEFMNILRTNLKAAAEQAMILENNLEVPHAR